MKFVPVSVNETLCPIVPLVGEIELSVGTGFDEVEITNTKFGVVPPPGAGLLTVTFALPEVAISAARMAAVNFVELTNVVVFALPLKLTVELWINPFPFTVSVNAWPPAVTVDGARELILGTGLFAVPPPGAPRFADASSITSTQSLPSGAVKLCEPLFAKDPIRVAVPLCGLYHQACAVDDAEVIFAMLIVFAVAFPSDRYAIIV